MSNITHSLKKYASAAHGNRLEHPRICLIRTNSIAEILASWPVVSELKQLFPDCHITTIVNEHSEAESIIAADGRIDHVIKLTPAESQNPLGLKKRLNNYNFDFVIAAFFAETPKRQPQRLLTLLFIPGKKFLYLNNQWLPLSSPQGIKQLITASFSFLGKALSKTTRILSKRRMPETNRNFADAKIRRILWMRPDFLGDVVLCLPTLIALKQHYPEAEIDAVVQDRTAAILENVPELSQIWKINFGEFSDTPISRWKLRQVIGKMRKRHYDLAIDFLGNDNVRELAYRLKVPFRVGFSAYANAPVSPDNSYLLTHAVQYPTHIQHHSQSRLELLYEIGLPPKEIDLTLHAPQPSRNLVSDFLKKAGINGPFAVLHTRTSSTARNWDDLYFAQVADYLIEKYNLDIILTGSSTDVETINTIINHTHNKTRTHNVAGQFNLIDLIALFEETRIMVTLDTGPMHIAAATQTPIVALLLPYFEASYPFGQRESTLIPSQHSVTNYLRNKNSSGKLLESIPPRQVFEAIDKKLKQTEINFQCQKRGNNEYR